MNVLLKFMAMPQLMIWKVSYRSRFCLLCELNLNQLSVDNKYILIYNSYIVNIFAGMSELVDEIDSKSIVLGRVGSSPTFGSYKKRL